MGNFRVTGPDGKQYQVTAPDGASHDEVLAKVQAHADAPRTSIMGGADATVRGFSDMATLGLSDKISAAANAVIPLDRLTGNDVSSIWDGKSIGDAYRSNLAHENQVTAADNRVNPNLRLAGQVAGGIMGPVPGRGLIAKAVPNLGKFAPLAKIAGESAAQSAAYGFNSGDSTNVGDRLDSAWKDGLAGGAGGLIGAGLVRGGARVLAPVIGKDVSTLANAGVTMTPGQRGGRIAKTMEQLSESIPFVREPIKAAKGRGILQFNKAFVNDALSPISAKVPDNLKAGRDAIIWAQNAAGDAIDNALAKIHAPADNTFAQALAATTAKSQHLPTAQRDVFNYTMQHEILPLVKGKQILDGPTLQKVNRLLHKRIANLGKANDGISDMGADALSEVRDSFMGLAHRHAGQGAKEFEAANDAWANMARVNDAASRPNSVNGVFTPTTASSAVARKGYGTTVNKLARGDARMQKLANAAKAVLPDSIPDSGTGIRTAWAAGLGALGSGAAGLVNPLLAVPAAGLVHYIPGIDKALQKTALRGAGKSTGLLADEIRKRAYIGGMIGSPLLLQKSR